MPTPRTAAPAPKQPVEIVDPRWLLRMFGLSILAALICAYLAALALFYTTSWQLVLHPTRLANMGTALPTQRVQFAVDATGKPRLSGEWYAAGPGATRATLAVLYLRSGDGQLDPADGSQIAMLHGLGLNVFAFDYSGYGASDAQPHPSEKQMVTDATAAVDYVNATYKPGRLLVFGNSLGVAIAADTLQVKPAIAAIIGYNADPEVLARIKADRRSKLFPIALFRDRFSLDALKSLKQPKLLYTVGPLNPARTAVYQGAADPKMTVEVPTHNADEERKAIARFLDNNFPAAPGRL